MWFRWALVGQELPTVSILGSEGGSQTDEDGGTEEGMAGREGGGSKVGV